MNKNKFTICFTGFKMKWEWDRFVKTKAHSHLVRTKSSTFQKIQNKSYFISITHCVSKLFYLNHLGFYLDFREHKKKYLKF